MQPSLVWKKEDRVGDQLMQMCFEKTEVENERINWNSENSLLFSN